MTTDPLTSIPVRRSRRSRRAFRARPAGWRPSPITARTSYKGSGKLDGRAALITGGDSGIGRAVAIAYAREGADVAISYLPEEQADAEAVAAGSRRPVGARCSLPGDLKDPAYGRDRSWPAPPRRSDASTCS